MGRGTKTISARAGQGAPAARAHPALAGERTRARQLAAASAADAAYLAAHPAPRPGHSDWQQWDVRSDRYWDAMATGSPLSDAERASIATSARMHLRADEPHPVYGNHGLPPEQLHVFDWHDRDRAGHELPVFDPDRTRVGQLDAASERPNPFTGTGGSMLWTSPYHAEVGSSWLAYRPVYGRDVTAVRVRARPDARVFTVKTVEDLAYLQAAYCDPHDVDEQRRDPDAPYRLDYARLARHYDAISFPYETVKEIARFAPGMDKLGCETTVWLHPAFNASEPERLTGLRRAPSDYDEHHDFAARYGALTY